jgi:hypothetical protein
MKELITKQFIYSIFLAKLIIKMFEASVEKFNQYITKYKVSHLKKGNYFEILCLEIFRKLGFTAKKSESTTWNEETKTIEILDDTGIDIDGNIVIQDVRIHVKIQCKYYQNTKLKGEQIQALDAVLSQYPNHVGIMMVYNKEIIEERATTLIPNATNLIYYYDITTIWNIIDDLTKNLDIFR